MDMRQEPLEIGTNQQKNPARQNFEFTEMSFETTACNPIFA